MKSIDVDAKHLIRTYIDGIEEYLREHTRLHPNEIDGLLNEINDFVYLRSGELASGERVHYNDVLKAIEECGSPSEICEQYLELDREEQPEPFSPKVAPSPSKPPTVPSQQTVFQPSKTQEKGYIDPYSRKFQGGLREFSSYYRRFPWFTLYRSIFILSIVFLNIALITYNPYLEEGSLWGLRSIYVSPSVFHDLGYIRCYAATLVAFFLVLLEGLLIDRWKTKLVREKGLNRTVDDTVIVFISRFTFLMLFFKTSLLYIPAYLLYTPIWLILACFIERQMKSQLWVERLGPWLVSLGSTLTNFQGERIKKSTPSLWTKINDQFSNPEKGLVILLIVILGFTFAFPWIGMNSYYNEADGRLYYDVSDLPLVSFIFVFLSLITMVGTLVVLRYYKSSQSSTTFTGESELIVWLMRLLAFKTILILGFTTDPTAIYLGSIIILGVLIASEITSNTYGGKTFRVWFGKALVTFGSSGSAQRINDPSLIHAKKQSATVKSETPVFHSQNSTTVPLHRSGVTDPATRVLERTEFIHKSKPSSVSRLFKGIGEFGKALIMTILLLLISFYEVVLAFMTVVTSFNAKGLYEVPVLEFNGGYISLLPVSTIDGLTEGSTITIWHTLLLLGIQLFFITTLLWYGLTAKKPEGVILKVCRNLTRILLVVVIIGSLVQIYFDDPYAHLRLLIILGLVFFSELTAWKVRVERKKWISSISEQGSKVLDNEEALVA